MSKSTWFESVAEAQRRAKKRLPPSVYGALLAGSEARVVVRRQHRVVRASSGSRRTSRAPPPSATRAPP